MDFELSDRAKDFRERLQAFMDEQVYPAEPVYDEQLRAADTPHAHPPVMEELKDEARERGLWNLFLPDESSARASPTSSTRRWPRSSAARHIGAGGVQLLGARHRQHGGAARSSARAEQKERWLRAAARRRDPLGASR